MEGLSIPPLRDMSDIGWTLIEDTESPKTVVLRHCQLIHFLQKGEFCISGEEMRIRANELKINFGQRHAQCILYARPRRIPMEWQANVFVFPRTLWLDSFKVLRVPIMAYWEKRWCLTFRILNDPWGKFYSFLSQG